MLYAFTGFSAVVPSLLLVWYFHSRDIHPEPPRVLWTVFALGIVIGIPVLLLAAPLGWLLGRLPSPLAYGFASAFLQAAIPEELLKFVVVWFFAARHAEFDEPIDGVVYGVVASLGFATLENVLYVANGGLDVAITRALTAVPSHAFLGAIMGYFVGRAKFSPGRRAWLTWALVLPITLHGLYDFPLLVLARASQLSPAPVPLFFALTAMAPLIVVSEWILAVRLTRSLRVAPIVGSATVAPGRTSSLLLTGAGALVAAVGGVLLLGFTAGQLLGVGEEVGAEMMVAGSVVLGLTPTVIGTALFVWGIRRLNEADAARRSV